MKHTFAVIMFIIMFIALLSPASFAGSTQFPGQDLDGTGYNLIVYKDHITIYGGQPPSNLPLQYANDGEYFVPCGQGTGICFTLTGSTLDSVETAIKNAWIAVLLKASSTGVPANVYWSDTDEHGQLHGIGILPLGIGMGLIYAVDFK